MVETRSGRKQEWACLHPQCMLHVTRTSAEAPWQRVPGSPGHDPVTVLHAPLRKCFGCYGCRKTRPDPVNCLFPCFKAWQVPCMGGQIVTDLTNLTTVKIQEACAYR